MADEEAPTPAADDSLVLAEVEKRAEGVSHLLSRKDKIGALKLALQNPPVASKSPELKVMSYKFQSL